MRRLLLSSRLFPFCQQKRSSHTGTLKKTKLSLATAVLRALVPKPTTVTQAKRLVQLGINYHTLQDIRCNSSTNTNFGKALADRTTKPISRETHGPDPNLRSRASALMPHLHLYFDFCYQSAFLTSTAYPKQITSLPRQAIGLVIRESL